jgi:alkylation response protein AidB-like acyl-CoA dehydrogenase
MSITRAELIASAAKAFDPAILAHDSKESWDRMTDLGWFMMAVPEDRGGLGLSAEASAVVHHAVGRALVPGAAVAQMFVIDVLSLLPQSDTTDALLERAMAGEGFTAPLSGDIDGPDLAAVPDADTSAFLLTRMEGQILLIPTNDCAVTYRPTWDETRRLSDVQITSTANAIVLAGAQDGHNAVTHAASRMLLSLAADSLGGAEGVLALTLDYLKTRRQFDRPIAMFQSLKHRAANLRAALSMADALLWASTDAADDMIAMGALKAYCTRVFKDVAEDCIQLHGGIGLTQEYPAHVFLKRAFLNAALGRDNDAWLEAAGRAKLAELE